MNKQHSHRFLWVSTAILLLAAWLRLFMLQGVPLGLARDEVRNAEIVSHILQGEHALFFRAGFGHEPLYHYFAVSFQVLLGDNVLSVRLPSVFLGMLLIAAVLRWAKRDFGQVTAVVAGVGLAVGWMPIIFSRVGIRPIMDPLFLLGVAWFWWKRPFWAGVFLGLSFYTYTAARVNFLIPLFFAGYLLILWVWQKREGSLWSRLKSPLFILGTAVVIYVPLAYTLQADPTLQGRVQELSGPLTALQAGDVQPVLTATIQTLGIFSFTGPPRWTYTIEGLSIFNWVTAIFFYIGLFVALWRVLLPRYAFVLIWLGVGLIPSAITPDFPSIIRIIGALPVIYLLPGIAIAAVAERVQARQKYTAVPVALALIYLIFLAGYTIANGFTTWPSNEVTRHKYQTIFQEMGEHWQTNPVEMMVVVDDFFEPIEQQSLQFNMNEDVGARWVQTSPAATGALVLPSVGTGLLYIPEYAAPSPDLLQVAGVSQEFIHRNGIRPFFTVHALPETVFIPNPIEPVQFDEKISFLGHMEEGQDGHLQLFTYWYVDSALPYDLTIFIHLLDEQGNLISQHDGFDAIPETLHQGDIVVQRHILPLTAPFPENYMLRTGLYLRDSGTRLSHADGLADSIILQESTGHE